MILVRCPECGERKAPAEFYANRRARSGITVYCKPCTRARNAAYRARRAAGVTLERRRPQRHEPSAEGADKRCRDCGEIKPLADFPRNRNATDGRHTYCKHCNNRRTAETRQRLYGGGRHYHLKRRYGLSEAEVQEIIDGQNGLCAICRERPAVHVDHDHATGMVRGVLCFTCNVGIANFGEDRERMRAAMIYLEVYEAAVRAQARRTA